MCYFLVRVTGFFQIENGCHLVNFGVKKQILKEKEYLDLFDLHECGVKQLKF